MPAWAVYMAALLYFRGDPRLPPKTRASVYIDGFNFYYGALRGSPHKWLNLERFCQLLRPADDLQAINYFTARVKGPSRVDQDAYLQALTTLPLVRIIEGRFKTKEVMCRVPGCTWKGHRHFQAPEEKETDVNIALQMLRDGYEDRCDLFVLVSGDSDLVPALNMVKSVFPQKRVFVYVPSRNPLRGAAVQLRSAADKDRTLPLNLLRLAQFPSRVPVPPGPEVVKPSDW